MLRLFLPVAAILTTGACASTTPSSSQTQDADPAETPTSTAASNGNGPGEPAVMTRTSANTELRRRS